MPEPSSFLSFVFLFCFAGLPYARHNLLHVRDVAAPLGTVPSPKSAGHSVCRIVTHFELALVAPALYEGIPEFLEKTQAAMSDIAVYASLYMGLVVTAGMSGFTPQVGAISLSSYYNGVCTSPLPRARIRQRHINPYDELSNALSLTIAARSLLPPPFATR